MNTGTVFRFIANLLYWLGGLFGMAMPYNARHAAAPIFLDTNLGLNVV